MMHQRMMNQRMINQRIMNPHRLSLSISSLYYSILSCCMSLVTCIAGCSHLDSSKSQSTSANQKGSQIIDQESLAPNLATLSYAQLMKVNGRFTGMPLTVSNNPEDVTEYGVLFSTAPLDDQESRNPEVGSPSPHPIWSMESESILDPSLSCSKGTVRDAYLYLAHILASSHLPGR